MTSYTTKELVSSSKMSKNFWSYISKISNNELEKIGILKNNNLWAVIISSDTYDFFIDLFEHIEIYNSIKERLNENDDFIDWDIVLNKFGLSI